MSGPGVAPSVKPMASTAPAASAARPMATNPDQSAAPVATGLPPKEPGPGAYDVHGDYMDADDGSAGGYYMYPPRPLPSRKVVQFPQC